jgi:hypothetical protein
MFCFVLATDGDSTPLDVILIPGELLTLEMSHQYIHFFFVSCQRSPLIGRSRASAMARATTTVSSLRIRPSLRPEDTPNPSLVSKRQNTCTRPTRPSLVGLALKEQVLDAGQVPVGTKDVSVDMIVTPDETIQVTTDGNSLT